MKRPENAEKLCYLHCNYLGLDLIGISNDGYNDLLIWKSSGTNTYGVSRVEYKGCEKAVIVETLDNGLDFTQMCSVVLNRISEMAKKNAEGEFKYA